MTEEQHVFDWKKQYEDLKVFFKDRKLPQGRFLLNKWTTIADCVLFYENSIAIIDRNMGSDTFLPYLLRLMEFKEGLLKKEKEDETDEF